MSCVFQGCGFAPEGGAPCLQDGACIVDFHDLVATPEAVEHLTEHHELGLFTDEDYRAAFAAAGLAVAYDAEGLMGRGLYIGTQAQA
jgi:hypothetical protein